MNLRLFFQQLIVLTGEELLDVFRRRRVVLTLALYLGSAVLVGRGIVWFQERLKVLGVGISLLTQHRAEIDANLTEQGLSEFLPLIDLLERVPSSVWIFQLFALFMIPTLATWLSSDMITIDVHRRTLRFILLRARRLAYVTSKVLAHTILLTIVHCIVVGVALVWAWQMLDAELLKPFQRWLLWYALIVQPFISMSVAGTALVSAWASRPMTALLLTNLLWFAAVVVMCFWPFFSPYNGRILIGLLIPDGENLRYAMQGLAAWTAIFFGVTATLFLRREV